jgi:riboflavin synthase alpha subunit
VRAGEDNASADPPRAAPPRVARAYAWLVFTGIIQHVGVVAEARETSSGVRLLIDAAGWSHTPRSGDSICISGCCLTVAHEWRPQDGPLAFDVVRETLDKTTLGRLRAGDRVNLEPSVRADSLMDGHTVQGHVEGLGTVERVRDERDDWRLWVRAPADLMPCVVPKGSVAIDGTSLTIAGVDGEIFSVALIPTTLERTTLGHLKAGESVNLETDVIARTVVHYLKHHAAHSPGPHA